MKKKAIAILLSLSMIAGMLPTLAFATSGETPPAVETSAPTEGSPVICQICQTENCTAEHKQCEICEGYDCAKTHVFCEVCRKYDCGVDHTVVPAGEIAKCETCGLEDCESKHETWCEICKKDDCGIDHSTPKTCETCGLENCESKHETWCEICKKDDCGIDHSTPKTCETCGLENCESKHETWCETCKKDDCGIDHSAPKTCETCGLENCESGHENWCDICKKDSCDIDHSAPKTCETCGLENCESGHENWCDICKKDGCGIDHSAPKTCETCGLENCESGHENWCDICKKDSCGIDHSAPKTCETCGETLTEGHTCPTDPVCSCSVRCKTDAPKADCPVCSAEGGVCTGSNKYMEVQAKIDALRTEFKESEREAALAEYETATKAISELSEEEFALLDLTNYYAAANPIVIPEETESFADTLRNAKSLAELYTIMTDPNNADAISQLTVEELKSVRAHAVTLYEADSNHSDQDDYHYNYLTGKMDNLIVKKDSNYLTDYLARCNCKPVKGVHKEDCPAYIPLPAATVKELDVTNVQAHLGLDKNSEPESVPLTYTMQFVTRKDYTDLQRAYYGDWIADFVISTNADITGKDAYLAGQYDAYDEQHWVWLKLNDDDKLEANTSLQLITMLTDWKFPFEGIIDFIPEFNCGIWVSDDYLQSHPGFAVTVELRLYPTDESGNYDREKYHTLSTTKYQSTLAAITYVAGTGGSVDKESEEVGTLTTPDGSTPTANAGYRFAGWYKDEAYSQAVDASWVDSATNKLIPGTNSSGIYDTAVYYAKFEELSTTVTYKVIDSNMGAVSFVGEDAAAEITDTFGMVTGSPKTAIAEPENGYMFVGWFTDLALTQKVDDSWVDDDNKLTPQKNSEELYEDGTYYAKFIKDHATVTITKTIDKASSSDQSFILGISGETYNNDSVNVDVVIVIPAGQTSSSVKVELPVSGNGTYTISDHDAWNWRYKVTANASIVIGCGDSDKESSVTSTLKNRNWFADSYVYIHKKES